jgi:hypothetical protein
MVAAETCTAAWPTPRGSHGTVLSPGAQAGPGSVETATAAVRRSRGRSSAVPARTVMRRPREFVAWLPVRISVNVTGQSTVRRCARNRCPGASRTGRVCPLTARATTVSTSLSLQHPARSIRARGNGCVPCSRRVQVKMRVGPDWTGAISRAATAARGAGRSEAPGGRITRWSVTWCAVVEAAGGGRAA